MLAALLYKHQSLFDKFHLSDCPSPDLNEIQLTAYRWAHSPIEHELNFLPNILYNLRTERPNRALDPKDMCPECNLSFFIREETARKKLKNYKSFLEKKHKIFTNVYTHIAKGEIEKSDGKCTSIENEHFGLYEYTNCELRGRFKLLEGPV
jgi:hypothetical protein